MLQTIMKNVNMNPFATVTSFSIKLLSHNLNKKIEFATQTAYMNESSIVF